MNTVVWFIVGGIFLFMGFSLANRMVRQSWRSRASRRWPATPGTIVNATTEHIPPRRNRPGYIISPEVAYDYVVDGKKYRGGRIDFGRGGTYTHATLDLGRAETFLADFPVGAVMPVYYDPRKPFECVLRPGRMPRTEAVGATLALVEILLGLFCCFIAVQLL